MIGIALGVMVLITVLSVMNGFDYEIHNKIFSLTRHVTVSNLAGEINNWQSIKKIALTNEKVLGAAPFISGQGMISKDGYVTGVLVNGIIPDEESKVSNIQSTMVNGTMQALKPGEFGIVLGQEIAAHLGVDIGDKVVLISPKANLTPVGIEPRFKRFTVVGVFHVGEGFGYDSSVVFINLVDAQKLYQMGSSISGVNIKINDLYAAPQVADEISAKLPSDTITSNWTDQYGAYFKAIRMEKTTMFVVLMFIIAVAAFNLVSTLVMTVNDKRSDIAILKTLGASPRTILTIFVIQGGIIGAFGTLLGVISGIIMALNAPELVKILEHIFNTHFISGAAYFINYLPSKLELKDIVQTAIFSFALSLLATIYPAWRASRTLPAEALRYE